MRRILWVVKIAVLVAASYCIFSPGGAVQRARAEGCDTARPCAKANDSTGACYCTVSGTGCSGCFTKNGDTSCGTCSSGGLILD